MKQQRNFATVTISRKGQAALEGGHPWVYEGEVRALEGTPAPGDLVDVISDKNRYLGTGFYSPHSKIRVRLVSRNANDKFDDAFWQRRLRWAWEYRKQVMGPDTDCCRLVFGEADSLPGLTVDRFGDVLVTQTLSVGIEQRKGVLFPLLVQILREDGQQIRAVYERNDVALRVREGLAENKGFFDLGDGADPGPTETQITENGIHYRVDFENGQKTGFFLDQKYNRQAVARMAHGRHVLDCFTHTGSFALNAAAGGAASVTAVDISEAAVQMARANAVLNGLEGNMQFQTANVFDLLPQLERAGGSPYDFIILDPPAFTKSRSTVDAAMRGYKEINYRAMKLLPRGGYLATASCSHFAPLPLFIKMLHSAAADAGVQLRQIEVRGQAPDHPVLWNVEETDYLKFFLFQVL